MKNKTNNNEKTEEKMSAFAVYRKLIPGVKAYEDHQPKSKTNKSKRKKPSTTTSTPPPKKKKATVPIVDQKSQKEMNNGTPPPKKKKATVPIVDQSQKEMNNGMTEDSHEKSIRDLINSSPVEDSLTHGRSLFEWMISPLSANQFMSEFWEKKPIHTRHSADYFKWLVSSERLDDVMRKNKLTFGRNVDITSYENGQRETHNPEGRALPATVWDFYSNGCSVRFLNPQTYVRNIWRFNSAMQEFFGTFVGSNAYLTPAGTQGFAPHYDDIEAFVIQVEGKKHWKLYAPRNENEILPRLSSGNFNEETDKLGSPILDVVLEEGDVLYFPRGIIHQAKALEDVHSLHLTISCYQTNTYGDLLKQFLPMALEEAQRTSVEFRRGLPTDFLSFMGSTNASSTKKQVLKKRDIFHKVMQRLVQGLSKYTFDLATDQLGKKFIWDSLPPYLASSEKSRSVCGDGEFLYNGKVLNRCEIDLEVEVKLVRKNCVQLVTEENAVRLYHSVDNSLEYHAEEPEFLEIPKEAVEGIKYLISKYPSYIAIHKIPIEDEVRKLQIISDLWERGILMTKSPLSPVDDEQLDLEGMLTDSSEPISSEDDSLDEVEEEDDIDTSEDEASSPPMLVEGDFN